MKVSAYSSFKNKLEKKLDRNFNYGNLLKLNLGYPEKKFVIYSRGRTGSMVLSDLLNCHPEIYCDVEIFHLVYCRSKILFPELYIKSRSKKAARANKPVYGFKVKISQLTLEHKYKDHRKIFLNLLDKGWKFLYLRRENYLRHKLSTMYAVETNIFHLKKNENVSREKIKVDCQKLLDGITFGEHIYKTEEEILKGIPHLKLTYEKDIQDNSKHQETADKIFKYLNLQPHTVKTDLKRVSSENLKDIILNYDEVHDFFIKTEYMKYFN